MAQEKLINSAPIAPPHLEIIHASKKSTPIPEWHNSYSKTKIVSSISARSLFSKWMVCFRDCQMVAVLIAWSLSEYIPRELYRWIHPPLADRQGSNSKNILFNLICSSILWKYLPQCREESLASKSADWLKYGRGSRRKLATAAKQTPSLIVIRSCPRT